MTENEFNSITEDTILVHIKHNREYKICDKHLRIKNSIDGNWEDGVTYIPLYINDEHLFAREKTSFLEEFEIKK